MCRIDTEGQREPKVYGVLTDYDLSSWKEVLKGDYTRTSQQRTGTPPYMAGELLEPRCTSHLYRHDLESLFYVMLLMCGRHTFSDAKGEQGTRQVVMREDSLPYESWFEQQNYETLAAIKSNFITKKKPIYVSEPFGAFRQWLIEIRSRFCKGFSLKSYHSEPSEELAEGIELEEGVELEEELEEDMELAEGAEFDDETLGGEVGYSTILDPIPRLRGELKGLTIRYNSSG